MTDRDHEQEKAPKVEQLEEQVRNLQPESLDTLTRVEQALVHLAAATADLEEIRRTERLARG